MPRVLNRRRIPGGQGKEVLCPFTIQVDTREQQPYMFSNLKTNKSAGEKHIKVPLEFLACNEGDYSILGMGDRVAIERKSREDLYGSVARRDNFIGRLERMSTIAEAGGYCAVVVEVEQHELLTAPPHSKLNPRSLSRTLISWRQRYRVDWYFVPGRAYGEAYTFRILERFWLNTTKGES